MLMIILDMVVFINLLQSCNLRICSNVITSLFIVGRLQSKQSFFHLGPTI